MVIKNRLAQFRNSKGANYSFALFAFVILISLFYFASAQIDYTNSSATGDDIDFTLNDTVVGLAQAENVENNYVSPSLKGESVIDDMNIEAAEYIDNGSLIQNINDCGVLNTTGAIYTLNTSINNHAGTCFNISADNIVLNLNGYLVDGTNDEVEAYYGIYAFERKNLTILNGTIVEFGDTVCFEGICAGSGLYFFMVNDSSIRDLILSDHNQAFLISSSFHNSFYNISTANDFGGIYLNQSSNNSFYNISTANDGAGLFLESSPDNRFYNLLHSDSYNGLYLQSSDHNSFYNVTASLNDNYGVTISSSLNNSFYNVTTSHQIVGMYVSSSSNNTLINGAYLYNNSVAGMYVSSSSNNTFTNIFGLQNNIGAYFVSSHDNDVYNFTVSSGQHGFHLALSNNNLMTNISGVQNFMAIYISSSSNNNFTNILSLQSSFGVYMNSGSNNSIINGIINSTDRAIFLTNLSSLGNKIDNLSIFNPTAGYSAISLNASANGTEFINLLHAGSYNFTGVGGTLTVRTTRFGEIKFLQAVNGSGNNLTYDVRISNNSAFVNSSQTGLNKSANVTFYGLPTNFVNPVIFKDGALCTTCYNFTSLNAGTVVFNVSSWSNYSIAEDAVDNIYPIFFSHFDNNGTINNSGVGLFNVSINNTNGSVILHINGQNIIATNLSANVYNASFIFTNNGSYSYNWSAYGNGTDNLINYSANYIYAVNYLDTIYPIFYNYSDNNATLNGSGIATFSVNVNNTNGTVVLAINNTNFTAMNLSANKYNVSILLLNGTYSYRWITYGNGTNNNLNLSEIQVYTLNTTPIDNIYPVFYNYSDNNATMNGSGLAVFRVNINNTNSTVIFNINGTNYLANNISASIYNYSILLMNGTYSYNWTAYGSGIFNNINISSTLSYTLNNSDEIYPIFYSFYSNNASVTNSGVAVLNVSVNDTNGSVILEFNNVNYTARNYSSNDYNVSTNVMNGTYTYRWIALGNGTSNNVNSSVTFYYTANYADLTAPSVNLLAPSNGINSNYINVSFNATFSDNVYLSNATFYLWNSTNAIVNTTFIALSGISNYSNLTVSLPYEGIFHWNYLLTDNSSNSAFNSSNFSLTYSILDIISPLVSIVSPLNISYNRTSLVFNVTLNENGSVMFSFDNGVTNYSMTTTNGTIFNYTFSGLTSGNYLMKVYANDTAGNINYTQNVSFHIDLVSPTLQIISPVAINYTNASVLVNISSNGQNVWYSNGTANLTYTNEVYLSFAQGTNTLLVYANDTIGNSNFTSRTFFVDSIAPEINLGSGNAVNGYVSNVTDYIYFNVSVNNTDLTNITFVLYNASSVVNTSFYLNGTSHINWSTLADGNYTYFAYIYDLHGNSNRTVNRTLIYDSIAPNINVALASSTTTSITTSVSAAGEISGLNASSCTISDGGSFVGGLTLSGLTCGQIYSVYVSCLDYAQNFDNASASLSTSACATSNGGGGGGGGGGGASTGKAYTVNDNQLLAGYVKILLKNDKIKFNLSGESHQIRFVKVENGTLTIEVSSTPFNITFNGISNKEVDVDLDGYNDIIIKLLELSNTSIKINLTQYILTSKPVNNTPDIPIINDSVETPIVESNESSEPAVEQEENIENVKVSFLEIENILMIITSVLCAIIVILSLMHFFYSRKLANANGDDDSAAQNQEDVSIWSLIK